MSSKVTCSSCGWSWNKSDSSKKDLYVCHQCGKDNTMKDGGWLNKFEDVPEAQNGIEGTMGGLTDKGFNYNGAWGGTMAMGGSLPGAVGFTYARTQSPAPSNGKYAKKTKASAQNGKKTNKNPNIQEQRYKQLYPPLIDKIINSASNDYESLPFGNRMFIETKFDGLSNPEGRNIPPMDPTIKEVQNKILALPESELNKLLKVDWKNISAPEAFFKRPKGIGMGDMFRYINHFKKLKSQGYTLQNGGEMKYYQEGLDWKPKNISKNGSWLNKYEEGGIIEDPMGQWAHPGEITRIPSNEITMKGVNYPVLGISDTGDTQMMYPGQDYTYDGESVIEYPMMQPGGKIKFGQKQKPDPFYNPLEYYQYTGKPIKQPWMPGDEKIKISDKRTMNAAANAAIRPNKDLVTGKYDADRISNIASVAKLYGIDPNLLLSIDLQETGFGTIGEDPGSESIGHTKGYNLSDLKTPSKRGSDEDVFDDRYDFFARAYLEKMAEGKRQGLTDSLDIIQNYNGRGIITPKTENKYHGFDMKEIYGVPLPAKGISMAQNPLYGKRIFDLRENVIKQNPDLQRLINLAKPTNKPVIEKSQMFQMPASNKKENGGWLNKYK